PIEERPLDDERDGEVAPLPPHHDRRQGFQDLAGDVLHDDRHVHVRVRVEIVVTGRAPVHGKADDLGAQRRLDLLAVRLELPLQPLVRFGHEFFGLIATRWGRSNRAPSWLPRLDRGAALGYRRPVAIADELRAAVGGVTCLRRLAAGVPREARAGGLVFYPLIGALAGLLAAAALRLAAPAGGLIACVAALVVLAATSAGRT